MTICAPPLPGAVAEILCCAHQTGVLTLADRYVLMATALDESLHQDERLAMDQLFCAVRCGQIYCPTA